MNIIGKVEFNPANINREEWSRFIADSPGGNVFHSPEYYDLLKSSHLTRPVILFYIEEGKILGILLVASVSAVGGPMAGFTERSVVWGGPVVASGRSDIASVLLDRYESVKGKSLFTQFRNLNDMEQYREVFDEKGYRFEDHLNIMINLSKSKETLWGEIHPTRRKQINRSLRRGVEAEEVFNFDKKTICDCYDLLSAVYKRERLPLPGLDYFQNAAEIFAESGILRLFAARHENRLIGFRMVLSYNKVLYDWYAASSSEDADKYPNDLLPWKVLEKGSDEGFRIFDFGGAGKPGVHYGVRDFKIKFGGEVVNYGRYNRVHRPLLYGLAMWAFNMRRKILR